MPTRALVDAAQSPEHVLEAAHRAILRAIADKAHRELGFTPEAAEAVLALGVAVTA
jgi:hypothetical protein